MTTRRRWFGPSRAHVWKSLCDEIQATYTPATFWKGDRVQVTHREWTVTLDTTFNSATKTTDTRLRAPYVNPEAFRFTIYRSGMFTELGKRMGMQDIEVGHPDFDRDFVIKGTHENRVRLLFENARIRELLEAQRSVHFTVVDNEGRFGMAFPENVDELRFVVPGVIKDIDRLRLVFDLFAETLDELCRMGSAYDDAPRVTL